MTRWNVSNRVGLWVLGVFCVVSMGEPLSAQDSNVVQVEEYWELLLAQPDPNTASPQISCTLSPQANLDGWYAVWTVNYGNVPDFFPGGVQLQLWRGSECVQSVSLHPGMTLSTPNEIVRWTLGMRRVGSDLVFEVAEGQGQSWGRFGSQDGLFCVAPGGASSFTGYDPAISTSNAEVGFGGNRVVKLVLKKVRYTMADGSTREDSSPRVTHQLAQ